MLCTKSRQTIFFFPSFDVRIRRHVHILTVRLAAAAAASSKALFFFYAGIKMGFSLD